MVLVSLAGWVFMLTSPLPEMAILTRLLAEMSALPLPDMAISALSARRSSSSASPDPAVARTRPVVWPEAATSPLPFSARVRAGWL